MRLATAIVSSLITALGVAVFLVFYAKPQAFLNIYEDVGVIVIIDVIAFVISYFLVEGTISGAFVKSLIMAFGTAFVIVYVLKPSGKFSFDETFLIVGVIEWIGLGIAAIMTRPKMSGQRN